MHKPEREEAETPPGATVTDIHSVSPPHDASGASLAVGDVLARRYRVIRYIAGGGMAEVYETEDTVLADRVAVKLLRPALLAKPDAHARFADEIRFARKVTHPNVCRVFDVGVDGDMVFFTMELHSGETLAGLLKREGALSVEQVAPLVRQILAGVGAAHEAGIVHSDLKPSNLLLTEVDQQQRVLVTDFGLAVPCCAQLGCACAMPHLIGTPAYVSPEQVEGETALTRSDVFSLGVILYEMLTGQLPYSGSTSMEMARARLHGDPPSPRAVRPEVDGDWDAVVRRCLARDPGERPCDAAELGAALGLG